MNKTVARRAALRQRFIDAFAKLQREGFTTPTDYAAAAMQAMKRPNAVPYANCSFPPPLPALCTVCGARKPVEVQLHLWNNARCKECSTVAAETKKVLGVPDDTYYDISEPHDKRGDLIVAGDMVFVLVKGKPSGTAQMVNSVFEGMVPKKGAKEKFRYASPGVILSSGYRVRSYRVLLERGISSDSQVLIPQLRSHRQDAKDLPALRKTVDETHCAGVG